MEVKYGFRKMTIDEFEDYISNLKIARTILFLQQHHTYKPSYVHFNGGNHFDLQQNMKQFHVAHNGWQDIGQHFTTFPDGSIITGRNIEKTPACILGNNANAVCIENLGNFDKGADIMNASQKETIIRMTAALCRKFNLAINTNKIVYHHWFDLSTGERNNGSKNNKTCPGSDFFGGNKVDDCKNNFLPLVYNLLQSDTPNPLTVSIVKYVSVKASVLNIREGAGIDYEIVSNRKSVSQGSILRVFAEKDGWLKISSSAEHWVYGKLTSVVKRVLVNADVLNVRTGPSTDFPKSSSLYKGQEVFITDELNGWCRISMESRWVKMNYLDFITN
ncbi:MAG TPA: SH3 domain-containing protein [Flavobacterium sp.]|nr:SH3 domain-containing protein [Flavobacterium sp.]